MVTSISGSAPYSYLDQLTGKTTAPAAAAPAPTTTSSTDAATAAAANAFGLPANVVSLLQSVGGNSTISSLLGTSSSTSNSSATTLLGGSSSTSADDLLASMQSSLLETGASSGLYSAALSAASIKKSASGFNSDYISKILAAYSAAVNQKAANNVDTSG